MCFLGPAPRVCSLQVHLADMSSGHHCILGVNLGGMGYGTPPGPRRGLSDELPCQEPLAPPPGFAQSPSCTHSGQKLAQGGSSQGGALHSAFWKELCSLAPVAGVQMLPEGLDFFLKRRERKEQKKALPVSGGLRGVGRGVQGRGGCGWLHRKRFISSVFIISCSPLKSNVLGAFVFNTHLTLPT